MYENQFPVEKKLEQLECLGLCINGITIFDKTMCLIK